MGEEEYWIVVVDDDISNLKIAGSILSENGMRVTALNSGRSLLEFIEKGSEPDLIMLDILMPGMDGFETLEALRLKEHEKRAASGVRGSLEPSGIPVVFLTADENKENEERGYSLGALDFIRKPFDPYALVQRIENIAAGSRRMRQISDGKATDKLTGLLSKMGAAKLLVHKIGREQGLLILLDIDSFRLLNEMFGHDAADRILAAFAVILQNNTRRDDIIGRINGDEFAVFIRGDRSPDTAVRLVRELNDALVSEARRMLGDITNIPLGVSGGAVIADYGSDYGDIFARADRMLLAAKRSGAHECVVYGDEISSRAERRYSDDLKKICSVFDENSAEPKAMCPESDSFGVIYRYIARHIQRYNGTMQKVLITVETDGTLSGSELSAVMETLTGLTAGMLRNSDVIYRSSADQLFLLLPMVSEVDLPGIMDRIFGAWSDLNSDERIKLTYVSEVFGSTLPDYPRIEGLDWRYAMLNLPTERLLSYTLADLHSSLPDRLKRLERYYEDIGSAEGLHSYKIEVHAMKSASALIGLVSVSGLARLLEGYAAAGDGGSIRLIHPIFVRECNKAHDSIGEAFGFDDDNETRPEGKALLPALLGVLEGSLREMDMEAVDRVLTRIRSYSYDEKTTESLDRLSRAAVELDDSAFEIIKELLK